MKASAIYKQFETIKKAAIAVWLVMTKEQRAEWFAWSSSVMTMKTLEDAVAKSREAAVTIKRAGLRRFMHHLEVPDDFTSRRRLHERMARLRSASEQSQQDMDSVTRGLIFPKPWSMLCALSPLAREAANLAYEAEKAKAEESMRLELQTDGFFRAEYKPEHLPWDGKSRVFAGLDLEDHTVLVTVCGRSGDVRHVMSTTVSGLASAIERCRKKVRKAEHRQRRQARRRRRGWA